MENNIYRLSQRFNLYTEDFQEKKYFLFDVEEGTVFKLNEVSHAMLSLFDGKRSVNEVLASLLEQYDIDEARLQKDFFSLLHRWTKEQILTII